MKSKRDAQCTRSYRFALSLLFLALSLAAIPGVGPSRLGRECLDAEFEITGTVETPVSLAGPHATMKLRAFRRPGLGSHIGPTGPHRTGGPEGRHHSSRIYSHDPWSSQPDPKRFEIKTERIIWNGRTFNVFPSAPRAAEDRLYESWRGYRARLSATQCANRVCGLMGCESRPYPRRSVAVRRCSGARPAAVGALEKCHTCGNHSLPCGRGHRVSRWRRSAAWAGLRPRRRNTSANPLYTINSRPSAWES